MTPFDALYEAIQQTHTSITGDSQTGKTSFAEGLHRRLIRDNVCLIVLDGKGDLFHNHLRFARYYRVPPKKLRIITPSDTQTHGFNLLSCPAGTDPLTVAGIAVDCLKKAFPDEEEHVTISDYAPAVFAPLIDTGHTFAEALEFLSLENPRFRDAVLHASDRPAFAQLWREFENLLKPYEQMATLRALKRQLRTLLGKPYLAAMLGQKTDTLNLRYLMDNGGLLLANLGQTAAGDPAVPRFLGALILHQINLLARARPKEHRPTVIVALDEFQNFITPTIASALDELNGLGIKFMLIHQHLAQLSAAHPTLLDSVLSNCRAKVSFATSDNNAQILVREFFAGHFYNALHEVKDELYQTKQRQTIEWIPIVSLQESDVVGGSAGGNDTFADGDGLSTAVAPDGTARDIATQNTTNGGGSNWSTNWQRTKGKSVTLSPVSIAEEFRELSNRTFYQHPEVMERYIERLTAQPARHCIVKLFHHAPFALRTPDIRPVPVLSRDLARFVSRIYDDGRGHAIPHVLAEIKNRTHHFTYATNGDNHADTDNIHHGQTRRKKTPTPL